MKVIRTQPEKDWLLGLFVLSVSMFPRFSLELSWQYV